MTEVCKCLNGPSSGINNDTLAVSKHRYNTRHYSLFVTGQPKADRCGTNSIPFRANQICNLLPREIKIQQTWILLNQKSSSGVA